MPQNRITQDQITTSLKLLTSKERIAVITEALNTAAPNEIGKIFGLCISQLHIKDQQSGGHQSLDSFADYMIAVAKNEADK